MLFKRLVFRKWGWYFVLLNRKRFKMKLLRFNGYNALSQQMHFWRDELWLYLTGHNAGHYRTYPAGAIHSYTGGSCYVLEIQYGVRCEEEDIVRMT